MFPLTIIMILSNLFLDSYNLLTFIGASLGIMIPSIEVRGIALRMLLLTSLQILLEQICVKFWMTWDNAVTVFRMRYDYAHTI